MAPDITLNLDLHTRIQITRPPTIQKGYQSFHPMVYERLSSVMEVMKVNAIKKRMMKVKVVMINGGNVDMGTNGFTSDVSLPKDEGK